MIEHARIPAELKGLNQWCLWKTVTRGGKPTKVPYQPTDYEAESNNPKTWVEFADALDRYNRGGYDGIGFMFGAEPGGFVGIDLDGCRDPENGAVAEWAKEIILKLDSYAEVSPSKSGVKVFVRGQSPFDTGKNLKLKAMQAIGGKEPGIEIYDHLRYFAVTGMRVRGPHGCEERQPQLVWLKGKFWPDAIPIKGGDFYGDDSVMERARKYLAKCPPAVSGSNGSAGAFHVACILVLGFGLSRDTSLVLFREWNQTCKPPWSERELVHKIDSAAKEPGPRNYLRNASPQNWSSVTVPSYVEPAAPSKLDSTTMAAAMMDYLAFVQSGGGQQYIELGLPDLEFALAGGVEAGEMVIVAARPSHGKSMLGLQFVHHWGDVGMPALVISEEMSKMMIGKRGVQFACDIPQEHWFDRMDSVRKQVEDFSKRRAPCHIVLNCRNVSAVIEQIDKAVEEHKVKAVVIDYAQLLAGKGKDRYEVVTNTSVALRQAANKHKLLMVVLCQLSREIEKRKHFVPIMSDLKESGQLEQDADVIVFLVWPWRIDNTQPPKLFRVYVAKNRNRAINSPIVECQFDPMRQVVRAAPPETRDEYSTSESRYANDF